MTGHRFEKKWSDAQRRAITYACTLHGLRPAAACQLAAAGKLGPDGEPRDAGDLDALHPYNPPVTTVREWVATERRRTRELARQRLEPDSVDESTTGNLAQLARVLDREVERISQRSRGNAPVDAEHVRRIARAVREVGEGAHALRRLNARPAPAAEPAAAKQSKPPAAEPGLLEHLAAQERKT